ncbi:MAG: DUF3365 domain-containing protein [Pirellulaceae bacterium]
MTFRILMGFAVVSVLLGAIVPVAFSDEELSDTRSKLSDPSLVDRARERTIVTQEIYAATLRMLHHRYFHRDRSVLPARAMQDIFTELEDQTGAEARWISASLKPMSIDHTPSTEFEKKAAKEIADGKPHLEIVEDGYYRRAVAIPLAGGCLGCHEGMFQNNGKKRFAGLVVSMPLGSLEK